MSLQDSGVSKLERILEDSKEDLLISAPELEVDKDLRVSRLSPKKEKIRVSEALLEEEKKTLEGLFHHHLNSLLLLGEERILLENSYLEREIPESRIEDVRNYFDDIVIALDLVVNKKKFEIAKAYKDLVEDEGFNGLLKAYLSEMTGLDFGKKLEDLSAEERKRWEVLKRIPFLNKGKLEENLRIFGRRFSYLKDPPLTSILIEELSEKKIKEGMKRLPRKLELQDYKRLASKLPDWLREEQPRLGEEEGRVKRVLEVIGRGEEKGDSRVLISKGKPGKEVPERVEKPVLTYYKSLAKRVPIRISSEFKEKEKGVPYPSGLTKFKEGDSIDEWRPLESYLSLVPGLAKKWKKESLEKGEERLPDLMIVLDSSGSMPDPGSELSFPTLGACAAAERYLKGGSKVGVVNFSDKNLVLRPSRDLDEVYEEILRYQGGGTTLRTQALEESLESIKTEAGIEDYLIVTDAGIENLKEFKEFFSEEKGRLTFLWNKKALEKRYGKVYERMYSKLKKDLKANFYEIETKKDLSEVVIK